MNIRESCLQTGTFIYKPGISVTKQDFHLQMGILGLLFATITYNIIDYARYFINGEIKYFKSYSFYIYSIIKKEEDNKESEFSLLSSF